MADAVTKRGDCASRNGSKDSGRSNILPPGTVRNTDRASCGFVVARPSVRPDYTNTISVVVAFSSQPRVGSVVTDEMSLMEIYRPRVLGDLISIFEGSQVCWLIFWCGAGL